MSNEPLTKATNQWICTRDKEVVYIFNNRREAICYLKDLLKQTLKDFDKQDQSNEFDYSVLIPELEIKPIDKREAYLSLL